MKRKSRSISLMVRLIVLMLIPSQAYANWPYHFPTQAKIKVDRNPSGQSWIYLEFMWGEEHNRVCPPNSAPNFERGKAVEFEIIIHPKRFLRPLGGKDDRFECDDVMGQTLPPIYNLPGGNENCYVDVLNYWSPGTLSIVPFIEGVCGDLDGSAEFCLNLAYAGGGVTDESGNFAVGVYDASMFECGVRYSIRLPVEVDSAYKGYVSEQQGEGDQCTDSASDLAGLTPSHPDWGWAQVTMQTFNNVCDLPSSCSDGRENYTCPHLIGISVGNLACENVDKHTDYWINRLCVPTGDWRFTPGYGTVQSNLTESATEVNSSDLSDHNICCVDRDGDGYFAVHPNATTYGSRTGDCDDQNPAIIAANEGEVCASDENTNPVPPLSMPPDSEPEPASMSTSIPPATTPPVVPTAPPVVLPPDEPEIVIPLPEPVEQPEPAVVQPEPVPTECLPTKQQTCGNCGAQTCDAEGNWGACTNQGVCAPGQVQEQACGNGGTQISTCVETCSFGEWETCTGEISVPPGTECVPGTIEKGPCETGGEAGAWEHHCNNGYWGPWGLCRPGDIPTNPTPTPGCQCTSGACCDGCYFLSSSSICESWMLYQCNGNNAEGKQGVRYCSGASMDCMGGGGSVEYEATWGLAETCASNAICQILGDGSYACTDTGTCIDTYISGSTQPCDDNLEGSGTPRLCLEVQQIAGSEWEWRVCKEGSNFTTDFSVHMVDQVHTDEDVGGTYANVAGNRCSQWHDVSLSYVTEYGVQNGAGLRVEVKSPVSCSEAACIYKTGIVTVRKECL